MSLHRPEDNPLRELIASKLDELPPAERRVAEYLRDHAHEIIFATSGEIGAATGTSDATVIRTAKALGYSGLPELKREASRQAIGGTRPSARLRSRIDKAGQEIESLIDHVFTEAGERMLETRRLITEEDLVAAVDLLVGAREIVSFGLGPSEMCAHYLTLRLRRLGRQARLVNSTGFRLADDLLGLQESDVMVLYVPGRLFNDVFILLDHAQAVGARVLLFTDSLLPILADRVTLSLTAVHSGAGYTGEGLSALLLTDCLLLGVAARDRDRATNTSELLNSLRTSLTPEPRRRTPRRPRDPEQGTSS
ncbi:DNA-binding transcriptional regulator, MurR/RpiR family, contains HTH and SIS domains [Nonomuraea maritima]|uniref:DNA-binding transcriptional regulator, MurR/RpiR family, contains HTH and SIS domains n=1 Tax=Nonomuraea maritima TaxID=683260 RepID=A0A1G8V8P8_9ACTN|nr:MurR/RpiR family transcriptional regulator [Nonomuraea maritima]SDJ62349.1 DNA-binding transcriptional regulator, MurR/RpiR family, contains HTH and SIS domains [Nonomuraea maritima]